MASRISRIRIDQRRAAPHPRHSGRRKELALLFAVVNQRARGDIQCVRRPKVFAERP